MIVVQGSNLTGPNVIIIATYYPTDDVNHFGNGTGLSGSFLLSIAGPHTKNQTSVEIMSVGKLNPEFIIVVLIIVGVIIASGVILVRQRRNRPTPRHESPTPDEWELI